MEPAISLKGITSEDIPLAVRKAKYAVRGPIVARAAELEEDLKNGVKYPFTELIYCNIGNPLAPSIGYQRLTYIQQAMACFNYPALLNDDTIPSDIKTFVRHIQDASGSPYIAGAYSHSQGLMPIRKLVAKFIEKRDNVSNIDPNDIFLSDGASSIIKLIMNLFIYGENDAILLPSPQYPLYAATATLLNCTISYYDEDEENDWVFNKEAVLEAYNKAVALGTRPKMIVIINPNNPTGSYLSDEDIQFIIRFAYERNILILADEVYALNIYSDQLYFKSFLSVYEQMEDCRGAQIVSVNSVSKGVFGECGSRGGYGHVRNLHDDILTELKKLASINLCPNLNGQFVVACMASQPQMGSESYALFKQEFDERQRSLREKCILGHKLLENDKYLSVRGGWASLYLYIKVNAPQKYFEVCEKKNEDPSFKFCLGLLENTGIVTVSSSGFEPVSEKIHFRLTILPNPIDRFERCLERIKEYTNNLLQKYE